MKAYKFAGFLPLFFSLFLGLFLGMSKGFAVVDGVRTTSNEEKRWPLKEPMICEGADTEGPFYFIFSNESPVLIRGEVTCISSMKIMTEESATQPWVVELKTAENDLFILKLDQKNHLASLVRNDVEIPLRCVF